MLDRFGLDRAAFARVIVLTGAGISASSGLPTFRGAGGMYEGRKVEDLATPEGFERDPELVWRWYSMRIAQVLAAQPNAGHLALAELEALCGQFTLITSNVDNLHERAGSRRLFKLHGSILEARCTQTGTVYPLAAPPEGVPKSPDGAPLRPNVVWFGERPRRAAIDAFHSAIGEATLVIEAGVSGAVDYGFTHMALENGRRVVSINPQPTHRDRRCHFVQEGSETALPRLVAQLRQWNLA